MIRRGVRSTERSQLCRQLLIVNLLWVLVEPSAIRRNPGSSCRPKRTAIDHSMNLQEDNESSRSIIRLCVASERLLARSRRTFRACSGSECPEACSKSGLGGDGPMGQPTPVQAPAVAMFGLGAPLSKKSLINEAPISIGPAFSWVVNRWSSVH